MKLNIVAVMCSKKKMERYKSLKEKYSELSNENLKYEVINSSANTKKMSEFLSWIKSIILISFLVI